MISTAMIRKERVWKFLAGLPVFLLFLLPMAGALFFATVSAVTPSAWAAQLRQPEFFAGLELSLGTGLLASFLSLLLSLLLASGFVESGKTATRLPALGAILAVPHLAVAIALGFLVMPTGMLARLLAIPLGWTTPLGWVITHDPWGVLLVLALVLKETPFLTYVVLAYLARTNVRQQFHKQALVAHSLGHGAGSIWARVILPQLLPVLALPLLVVFSYAATVVDVSLAIGPTQPPTLATLIWADLNSSDPLENARGSAGAFALTAAVAGGSAAVYLLFKMVEPLVRSFYSAGPDSWPLPKTASVCLWRAISIFYILLLACLVFLSFARLWPFPDLMPRISDAASWRSIAQNPSALITSLVLGLVTSLGGLGLLLLWFETQSPRSDKFLLAFSLPALALPALVIGLGQYQMLLSLGLTGTLPGLYLVHLMPVFAYMYVILAAPYRAFDHRWKSLANGLQSSRLKFLLQVKWPLLKPQLLASLAIGFAVSFGQYVPAQLAAAGRYSTLPMEAISLTAGVNRPLTASYALLLGVAPFAVFMFAAMLSRPRWSRP